MNPKIAWTIGIALATGALTYSAYRVGEEVGKTKNNNEWLERLALKEQQAMEAESHNEKQPAEQQDIYIDIEAKPEEDIPEEDPDSEDYSPNELKFHETDEDGDEIETIRPPFDAWGRRIEGILQDDPDAGRPISEVYRQAFEQEHPKPKKKPTLEELNMEATEKYIENSLRYINNPEVREFLRNLEGYFVEDGPAVDQIAWENSVDKRNQIREHMGLEPVTQPTWFDMYMYFLHDFEDEIEELNTKAADLLWVWNDYTTSYIDEPTTEDIFYDFSNNILPVGNHYSPFSLTQAQVNFLEEQHRNNLTGQKNEWITVESPAI